MQWNTIILQYYAPQLEPISTTLEYWSIFCKWSRIHIPKSNIRRSWTSIGYQLQYPVARGYHRVSLPSGKHEQPLDGGFGICLLQEKTVPTYGKIRVAPEEPHGLTCGSLSYLYRAMQGRNGQQPHGNLSYLGRVCCPDVPFWIFLLGLQKYPRRIFLGIQQ